MAEWIDKIVINTAAGDRRRRREEGGERRQDKKKWMMITKARSGLENIWWHKKTSEI